MFSRGWWEILALTPSSCSASRKYGERDIQSPAAQPVCLRGALMERGHTWRLLRDLFREQRSQVSESAAAFINLSPRPNCSQHTLCTPYFSAKQPEFAFLARVCLPQGRCPERPREREGLLLENLRVSSGDSRTRGNTQK